MKHTQAVRDKCNAKRLFDYHNGLNKQLEKNLFYQAKDRAKKNNIEFNLDLDDIVVPKICLVLGVEIKPAKLGHPSNGSPSIDRIDSSKGYVKGNIKIISYRANVIKSNGTISEHEKIISYMRDNLTHNSDCLNFDI